ncbi:hypothetical protein AcV7_007245 [Taiwanofungus camphoratus]|nr:hypothetical protein AcV7_007245 [Antrodia cinnamomea]
MDAMDVNWCLTCSRHIDTDGTAPYCSRECFASDKPSTSAFFAYPRPVDYNIIAESISELDDFTDECSPSLYDNAVPTTERSRWIGRGDAGIHAWARDVPPGPPSEPESTLSTAHLRPPKLLLPHRRPVPPTLCMSKTTTAPAQPSRPILTPQQSLPSLLSHSTDASYTTPSSSVSVATPVSEESLIPPSVHPPKSGLMGALTAHFRSWAASSASKDSPRSKTVTREPSATSSEPLRQLSPLSQEDYSSFSDGKSGWGAEADAASWAPGTFGPTEKVELTPSSPDYDGWRTALAEDHPAFRYRGRRTARVMQ